MSGLPEDEWRRLLEVSARLRAAPEGAARTVLDRCSALRHPLARLVYAPLLARIAAAPLTMGQIGQSLDARIATESGHSQYVNGAAAFDHLHRLRALADAVIVGATTVVTDDPQLTTRRVPGPSPVRVILDPHGRVPAAQRVFDGAAPTLVLRSASCAAGGAGCGTAEVVRLDAPAGLFPPQRVLATLHARGLRVVLIEGGGATLSIFLRAGAMQRLHVMLAPLLIGPGRDAFRLAPIPTLNEARRFRMQAHVLAEDVLLDCDLENGV